MTLQTQPVVTELTQLLSTFQQDLARLEVLPEDRLQHRPDTGGWNALECLEHLNRYAAFYLPELTRAIEKAPAAKHSTYRSGWLGNWFANLIRAEKAKPGKMKAPASKNPAGVPLDRSEVLDTFWTDLTQIQRLLAAATSKDWNAVRVPISLSPWIRLNLGDVLRFYIHHLNRHRQQAIRAAGLPEM
ncbi:MAG: DinB family protein [Sphingobacteriales bacterium]|nr:MAG: DinB family protein [Sphingobacteriales bacterium]